MIKVIEEYDSLKEFILVYRPREEAFRELVQQI